jgi:hypothetical protein
MRVRASILAVAFAFSATSPMARANDTTIPCASPPDKGASVAVHPGSQVSKTQDHQNGTCIFAINGAVATSPPPRQVLDAINFVRDSSRRMMEDPKGFANALAAIMAASAPVDQVPTELASILTSSASDLTECARRFFSSEKIEQPAVASPSAVICYSVSAYADERDKHEILGRGGTAVGIPNLVVSAIWGGRRFLSRVGHHDRATADPGPVKDMTR